MYRRTDKKSALTLVELLIAMLLFSAITGATVLMFNTGLKIWSSSKDRIDIRQNGSLAMERMIRYLELARNITTAAEDSITFTADLDNNGLDETITIAYDAVNKIDITIAGSTTTLTRDVNNLVLTYYGLNTETAFTPPHPINPADRASIRVINISITMSKGSDTVTLSSSAFCRNQGYAGV